MGDLLMASFTVRYDAGGDVLYLSMKPAAPAWTQETEPGVLWRYDAEGGALIGVTVVDFGEVWRGRERALAELIAVKFGVACDEALAALPTLQ
jgi:uncharacterized protein YuzE